MTSPSLRQVDSRLDENERVQEPWRVKGQGQVKKQMVEWPHVMTPWPRQGGAMDLALTRRPS
jgi:hypothetical protein